MMRSKDKEASLLDMAVCVSPHHCNYVRKERKRGRASGDFIIEKRKGGNKEDRLISKE